MTHTALVPRLLWNPSDARVRDAWLTRFARHARVGGDYHALWRWSIEDLEGFWSAVWTFFDVRSPTGFERVLADDKMAGAAWFPGTRVNYAARVFHDRDPSDVAIRYATEGRSPAAWTWADLRAETARCAAGLRERGVGPGDRVGAYLPNVPEAVAAFLATASLGAVWSSAAPEFGPRSVIDRFAQVEPKVLLAVDGYRYGGRAFDRRDAVREIAAQIPTLEHVVTLGHLDHSGWPAEFGRGALAQLEFREVPFEHPLWILYSSGTTGLPKAIVHSQGGMLLEHLKKLHLHLDLHEGDRLFWFTTTGWMMWNFLVAGLLTPASIVLYNGHPAWPDHGALWDLAERTGITTFGTSAAYIAACMNAGLEPADGRDLTALQAVGSTGSPLAPEGFRWIHDQLGEHVWPFSTSGGTDLCTAFVGGVPTLPVHEGELQARSLGAAVEAWDPDGRPLVDAVGELVITRPMPSMPIRLWNDPDGSRLHDAYFSTYPGVWRHGDWIEITSRGSAIISGRSDATINRGGIRMGTSEIYRSVLGAPEVLDALVVDVPREGAESWMPLFVVLCDGEVLSDELEARIRRRVREGCSPRHVPDTIHAIAAVPRTRSGKALEVPVKRILMGDPVERVASRDSLAIPEALDVFVELARATRAEA